jgi:hypothetical protein
VELAREFGVDVLGYCVMSNHLHVILRTRPDRVEAWSDHEVARRWLSVYTPVHLGPDGEEHMITDGDINGIVWDEKRLGETRVRLSNLSWFMKALNEHISRRANREDGCKGRFWESRFGCQRIDDEAALLACMCYVDLNPVRAQAAKSLEEYDFTSIHDRMMVEKAKKRLELLRNERMRLENNHEMHENSRNDVGNGENGHKNRDKTQDEDKSGTKVEEERLLEEFLAIRRVLNRGRFLVRLDGEGGVFCRLSAREYYRLVDWTGRQLRKGKAGVIGEEVRPLLESLDLDAVEWLETVRSYRKRFGLVAGTVSQMRAAARRAGQKWWKGIRGVEKVFRSGEPVEAMA